MNAKISPETIDAGQAIYSKKILMIYDIWVLGISNTFIWRCPTRHLRALFSEHVSNNHLDVGVGTGYFLDKCLKAKERRVALLDLNPNSLAATADRIQRFSPEINQGNVLAPISLQGEKFASISINYLLHCLPGTMTEKSQAFGYLAEHLMADGVLFGSTILGQGLPKSFLANKLMRFYNEKGAFSNLGDDMISLKAGLKRYFEDVEVRTRGCVAIFVARTPKLIAK
ncbi:class I SAM-dependent methyltransferase [Parashewanella tropica]|uniref:class I SAM-dependent methyltransferase n=1 Tax=Parashewanella tropica TaxID=2547970 RepID=UPI0014784A84|nr:class I SAM-dependent methyltransferase [Parashewanella tropica]